MTNCDNKETNWPQRIEAACAVLLVIITGTYTYYAAGQLHKMKRSTDAAQSAATTAAQTLINQQKSFEIDQRPYLVGQAPVFSGPGFVSDQPLYVNVTVKDVGRTPAVQQLTFLRLVKHRVTGTTAADQMAGNRKVLERVFNEMREREAADKKIMTTFASVENDTAPGADFFLSNFDKDGIVKLSGSEFKLIQTPNSPLVLYALGLMTYGDKFENRYETQYCWLFFGPNPSIWHRCDAYNAIK